MFEKLLSRLPYNPSLVHQLSFYGRRMRQESSVRRTGVAFLLMAFMVQFFAFVSPPVPTLADSTNDLVNGGITSAADAAGHCTKDTQNYKTILAYYGISCSDVARAATVKLVSTADNKQLFSMGRLSYGQTNISTHKATSETQVRIPGLAMPLYLRYLWSFDSNASSTYSALKGTSSVGGKTFYVLYNCANLVFVGLPTPAPAPTPKPVAAPSFTVVKGVKAQNQSTYFKNINAKPGDAVDFSIGVTNTGNTTLTAATVKDALPTGLTAVPGSLSADGKPVVALLANFNTGSLLPGQYKRVTFSAKVAAPAGDCSTYTNTVTVTAGGLAPKQDSASVAVCKPAAVAPTPTPNATPTQTPTATPTQTPTAAPTPVQAPAPVVAPVPVAIPVITPTTAPTPCAYNLNLAASSPECKPCDKSVSTSDTLACVVRHKSAANLTQNLSDANNTTAAASDKIEYTLYAQNQGKAIISDFVFQENISDVLDYADISDLHGATKDADGLLTWPKVDIAAGKTATVKVTVTVKSPIPQTPQVQGTGRFDHVMTNTYTNTVNITVPETPIAAVQTTAAALPNTGPGENLAIAATVFLVAGYFFARSRLLASEAFIAVQDNNSGGF